MNHTAKLSGREGDVPVTEPPAQPFPDAPRGPAAPPAPQTPHPSPRCTPQGSRPVTDGTPVFCRQRNAAGFLAGNTPGVMAAYGAGGREPGSSIPTLENEETVRELVRWRQEAPYG